jgi:hypothetical protein
MATYAMFLGPHVGAQHFCTRPPLALKGEACNVTRQAHLAQVILDNSISQAIHHTVE